MGASSNSDAGGEGDVSGHIFLSYSREERGQALQVISLLEDNGIKVWWDGLLEGGENYLPTTEAALENATCVVVLWSKISVDSHWVRDEAQSGRERRCLVPISIDGTQAPLGFRQFQTIDASGWKGKPGTVEADQILTAVSAQFGATPVRRPVNNDAAQPFMLGRRGLIIGGAGLAGAAALGVYGFNALQQPTSDFISLAVTPFENLSGDPEQVWFSGGLSNELRAALARNPRLRVSAPTSSAGGDADADDQFDLGRKLGVANLLRGSVQLADGIVRVSAELVQVEDGVIRWAESFDRQFEDVLAIQSEIASIVARSLVAQIAGAEEINASLAKQQGVGGTDNVAAYEAYLRGHSLYDLSSGEASDRAALAQFDAAIAADPGFAAAYAMRSTVFAALANATTQASEIGWLYAESITGAEQAIELAPNLAQGHLAKGFALNHGRFDRQAAKPHYDRARELEPGNADVQRSVATFLAYGSEQETANEIIAKVLALDPLNARAFSSAGYIALLSRRYDDVIAHVDEALKLNPELVSAHYALGSAQYLQGATDAALASYEQESVPLFGLTGQAMAHKELGDDQAAQTALDTMIESYGDASLYQQAQIQAQWGNSEAAMALLDRALAAKDPGLLFLPNDPMLDPIREAPGFSRLQSKFTA